MKRLWYWFKKLQTDTLMLYYAFKDPRFPFQAKALLILLVAYIISPIDILPEFVIPGVGYIDDIVLVPLGAQFILKMIPEPVISEANLKTFHLKQRATFWTLTIAVLVVIIVVFFLFYKLLSK